MRLDYEHAQNLVKFSFERKQSYVAQLVGGMVPGEFQLHGVRVNSSRGNFPKAGSTVRMVAFPVFQVLNVSSLPKQLKSPPLVARERKYFLVGDVTS